MAIQFKSPAAAISEALMRYMRDFEMQRRQNMEDALRQREFEADQEARRADLAERQRSAARQTRQDEIAEADRAARIYGPDTDLTPEVANALKRGGYNITERQTLPARTLAVPVNAVPGGSQSVAARTPALALPSNTYARRNRTYLEEQEQAEIAREQEERDAARAFQFHSARVAADERADQAELNRNAAAERAAAERDTRELIARLAQSGNAETRALANELRRIQITAEQEKLNTTRTERDRTASSARQSTQAALDSVDKLLKSPGIGAATGAYEMRGFTQAATDFNSERDQLVALLTLPNLGALRGPLSDKDVIFVKQIATKLANTRMSEAETRAELNRVKLFLQGKMREAGGDGADNDPLGLR